MYSFQFANYVTGPNNIRVQVLARAWVEYALLGIASEHRSQRRNSFDDVHSTDKTEKTN